LAEVTGAAVECGDGVAVAAGVLEAVGVALGGRTVGVGVGVVGVDGVSE
jgi:hypothetical protein